MNMSPTRRLAVATVSALVFAVAGCGGPGESETAPTPQAPAAGEPQPEEEVAPADVAPAPATAAEETTDEAAPSDSGREAAIEAANMELAGLTGDATAGKRVFVKCMACHTAAEGKHSTGPSLYGVIGREAASVEGFPRYSKAMRQSDVVWTEDALFAYLANPAAFIPGNGMIFLGLPSAQDRADVIAYLESVTE